MQAVHEPIWRKLLRGLVITVLLTITVMVVLLTSPDEISFYVALLFVAFLFISCVWIVDYAGECFRLYIQAMSMLSFGK